MADRRTVRELIEEGLSTTESLISQKDYTKAMICSRQTLEFLVRSLCRRNDISDSDPEQMVESLYLRGIISKEVCGEFFKIYKFGELAAVQGYNDTFSANESYRLLSQAVYAYQQMLQSQTMHRNGTAQRSPKGIRRHTQSAAALCKVRPPAGHSSVSDFPRAEFCRTSQGFGARCYNGGREQ